MFEELSSHPSRGLTLKERLAQERCVQPIRGCLGSALLPSLQTYAGPVMLMAELAVRGSQENRSEAVSMATASKLACSFTMNAPI